jgi:hypothetical protein
MRYLNIEGRNRLTTDHMAGIANFSLVDGEAISTDALINDPNISFYCLDDAEKRAIFVELPPTIDLGKAPFVYLAQYEHAQRFISVPYADFKHISAQLPALDHLILIYMTGRSGSTLLSQAFGEVDNLLSLSEIESISQFFYLRMVNAHDDAELRALLEAALRWSFKPSLSKPHTIGVLKLQSDALDLMDVFQAVVPHAKNIFLYRDAVNWVASFYRILRRKPSAASSSSGEMLLDSRLAMLKQFFDSAASPDQPDKETYSMQEIMSLAQQIEGSISNPNATQDFASFAPLFDPNATALSAVELLTLWWVSIMDTYRTNAKALTEILPLRYQDLNDYPQQIMTNLFDYCGIPRSEVAHALRAFDKDSQAGTSMARDTANRGNQQALTDQQIAEITAMVRRHPILKDPNIILPGSLTP